MPRLTLKTTAMRTPPVPHFRQNRTHAVRSPLPLSRCSASTTAGCARTKTKGDLPYVARDVGTLYSAAKLRLDQGRYKEAAQLFDEVERQHPYSIWGTPRAGDERVQLLVSSAAITPNRFQSSQRFLSVHPGNRDAPYAYYLIALSYYEQIKDVTRDQKISRQALDSLGELVRRLSQFALCRRCAAQDRSRQRSPCGQGD